jgi:hypothetical protein
MERRYEALCREMSLLHENELSLSKANDVKEKAMTLFLSLMCYRIDIFFGRHPDQIMLCTLYIVCSKMELAPKVTFREVLRAYRIMKETCLSHAVVKDIVYRIKYCTVDGGTGDIVSFYNVSMKLVFLLWLFVMTFI